jgi:hypothetical protein
MAHAQIEVLCARNVHIFIYIYGPTIKILKTWLRAHPRMPSKRQQGKHPIGYFCPEFPVLTLGGFVFAVA